MPKMKARPIKRVTKRATVKPLKSKPTKRYTPKRAPLTTSVPDTKDRRGE